VTKKIPKRPKKAPKSCQIFEILPPYFELIGGGYPLFRPQVGTDLRK
jgi:hypothetical protein